MNKIKSPYIVYTLPNNKFDQRLKNNQLELCWNEIEYLLSSITSAEILQPKEIRLSVFTHNNILEPEKSLSFYNSGIMEDRHYLDLLQNGKKSYRDGEWILNNNVLILAKDFFQKIQRKIKSNADIALYIHYSFYLKDPKNGTELNNQQFLSSLTLYFSKDIKCVPTLFFPFENASEEFWSYFDSIKAFFPFEIDDKYLKLSRIKNGEITSFKKIIR